MLRGNLFITKSFEDRMKDDTPEEPIEQQSQTGLIARQEAV